MIKFSAPGKIHLLGEHAVVYGKPAILAAVNLRAFVTISKGQNNHPLKKIIEPIVKNRFNLKKIPLYKLDIDSQIPLGSGLGSSAAISSAYIAALLTLLKIAWDKPLINELAYEAEKVFHGNPSGGDNTTVVYGGLIWYKRSLPSNEVKRSLPLFNPLLFKIHKDINNFYLIDSGKPVESTKNMVDKVRSGFHKSKSKFQEIFNDQEQLVIDLAVALKDGDEKGLIEIIRQGQRNLQKIGVSGKKAQQIIKSVEELGGAAKILGGGGFKKGSGMILTYLPKGGKITHYTTIAINLGEEGLRKENA